uniref:Uncharacterized protein n=1 Tax=Heterorhabditis bacteriophora TaxID=37862 RepID=A0A1I7WSN8_HETBA
MKGIFSVYFPVNIAKNDSSIKASVEVLCLRAQALVLRPREDCQLRSDVSSRTTALRNETHDKAQFREYE